MKGNTIVDVVVTIAVIVAVLCAGCAEHEAETPEAKVGDIVTVHYTGTLDDGRCSIPRSGVSRCNLPSAKAR